MISATELVQLQDTLYSSSNPTRRWLHCSRRAWIKTALRELNPPAQQRALEVGPGSGVYLPLLSGIYDEVVASDIEAAYLAHATARWATLGNLTLVLDNICDTRMEPHSFDCILCTEVIEHIADSSAALRGMRRLLKPGGVLVLSTPQRYSPLELSSKVAFLPGVIEIVRWIYDEPILPTGHINLMTAATVQAQLAASGFRIEKQHRSGMYLPIFAELGGSIALRLEQWLDRHLRGTMAGGLLWTQFYVARAC